MLSLLIVNTSLIFLLCISKHSALAVSQKIYSLDGASDVSAELSNILITMKHDKFATTLAMASVKSDIKRGDRNISLQIEYSYFNGDYGGDILQFLMINHDKTVLKEPQVYINISKSDDIIQSNTRSLDYVPKELSDKAIVKCDYVIPMISYQVNQTKNNDISSSKRIIQIHSVTFVLLGTKVLFTTLENTNIKLINIEEKEANSNEIPSLIVKNIYGIDQPFLDEKFLIIENDNDNLYMYQVINFTSSTEFSLSLKQKIILDSAYRNPLKIGYKGTHLYLIVKNIGLVECSFITNSNYLSYKVLSSSDGEKKIIDFVVNDYSIYAISEGVGLYIYNYNNLSKPPVLYQHQYMKQIDYKINPFYGTRYVGIGFNTPDSCREVFMELLLIDEFTPIPNKIFTSCSNSFLNFFSIDKYYSFLYNTEQKYLYVIRRAILGDITFVTYRIKIENDLIYKNMFSLSDKSTQEKFLMLSSDQGFLLEYSKFSIPNQSLNCSFTEKGNYIIRFTQKSDACLSSIEKIRSRPYPICQKLVDFNYYIYGDVDDGEIRNILTFVMVLVVLTTIVIFFVVIIKTNCFRKNTIKLIKIDKDDRDDIYNETADDIYSKEFEYVCKKTMNMEKPRYPIPQSNRNLIRVRSEGLERKSSNDILFQISKRSSNEFGELSPTNYEEIPRNQMSEKPDIEPQIINVKKWKK